MNEFLFVSNNLHEYASVFQVDQKFKLNLKFARKNKNPSARQIKKYQQRKDNWNLARGMPQTPVVLNRQVMERKALLATRQGRAKLLSQK